MTPSESLARALALPWPALKACADLAKVPPKIARRASFAKPVNVDHYLRLCAACGHDPFIEARNSAPFALGRFSRTEFAATIRRYRQEDRRLNIQAGAKAMGISVRALSFIENGRIVSIDAVLAACRFVRIHPFAFARRESFTGNTWCNPSERSTERAAA